VRFTHWKTRVIPPGNKVSLVIVTHHRHRQLVSLLWALRAQTHEDFEVLVAHDGPADRDWSSVLKTSIDSDPRFTFEEHPRHVGQWGYPIRDLYERTRCTGEWVGGFADDDWCCPVYLEWLLSEAIEKSADFVFCNFVHNHANWKPFTAIPQEGSIGIGGWLARRKLVESTPYADFGETADGKHVAEMMKKTNRRAHVSGHIMVHG